MHKCSPIRESEGNPGADRHGIYRPHGGSVFAVRCGSRAPRSMPVREVSHHALGRLSPRPVTWRRSGDENEEKTIREYPMIQECLFVSQFITRRNGRAVQHKPLRDKKQKEKTVRTSVQFRASEQHVRVQQ